MTVLVAGATGIVGSSVVRRLRLEGIETLAISRRGDPKNGVVRWGLAHEPMPKSLDRNLDAIVNCSASTNWGMEPAVARLANVSTTESLLKQAQRTDARMVHLSTTYSTGLRGSIESRELSDYRNSYEWSKAESERCVADNSRSWSIIRAPLIVGERGTGWAARFSGLYQVVKAVLTGAAPALVGDADARCEIVSVTDVVDLVMRELGGHQTSGTTHILGRGEDAPTVGAVVLTAFSELNACRRQRCVEEIDIPVLIPGERWDRLFLPLAEANLRPQQLRAIALLSAFRPYLGLEDPYAPTERVAPMEDAIRIAIRFWCESNERLTRKEVARWRPK